MENKLHVLKMNNFIFKKALLLQLLELVLEQEYIALEASLMSWDSQYFRNTWHQQLV